MKFTHASIRSLNEIFPNGQQNMNMKGILQETTKAAWTCIELGTILGPEEDNNRIMTSLSETHIKLLCNGIFQVCKILPKTLEGSVQV